MNNALDVILMSILDMIGIESQDTKDVKSGKKAIENTKGNRLSPKDQKFKTKGQTEMFNQRGKLRNFKSPAQSANQPPTTSSVPTRSNLQATPPNRPSGGFGQAPGQGQLGGEVPRNTRLRAPTVPPRMGTPTAAGPQTKPPIRGESYKDLKAKPQPKAPGVKGSTPKPTATAKPATPKGRFPKIRGGVKGVAAAVAVPLLIEALRNAPGPTGRKFNELMKGVEGIEDILGPGLGTLGPLQNTSGTIKAMKGVLETLGLVDEGYFNETPEAPELPESDGITMPEITPQPMNLSEQARQSYWDQAPLTPVVPPRNPSQAPVRATREQLRPQIDPSMPNMGYETVSPNRGQLAPNPFRR